MNITDHLGWLVAGLVIAGFALYFLFRQIKPAARVFRKRRRNYGKVIATAKRPIVILSSKTGKS